ncbi:MAG: PAS domain S-box protein [Verrucomicrobia bacterium]|nr:PAS domain S-box protein [Verrucomicrobiota bacterium]
MPPHPPLRYSLPLGFLAMSAMLIAVAFGLRTREINQRNEALMQQRAAGLGQFVSPEMEEGFARGTDQPARAVLARLKVIPHLQQALICDEGGVINAAAPALPGRRLADVAAPLAPLVERARREGQPQFAFSEDRRTLWAAFPLALNATGAPRRVGCFCTGLDIAAQKAPAFAALRNGDMILLGLVALCSAGLWWYSHHAVSHRAMTLVATTQAMAAGRLDIRSNLGGRDELAQVGEAINRMAGQVQARETAQQASEARTRSIVENAMDGIITIDHEGLIVDFNPAAERIFGHAGTAVRGRSLADVIIPPALRERHNLALAHCIATGESHMLGRHLELTGVRADGREFPIELTITRLPSEPPQFTGFVRDNSERKSAETLRNTLLSLEAHLGAARTPQEAGRVIFAAADTLWSWDAGSLEVSQWDKNLMHTLLTIDVIDGRRREVEIARPVAAIAPRARRVLEQGAVLILRQPPLVVSADTVMFGDTTRLSASIMAVPIRWQTRAVGVLSVQSYAFDAFTEQDLATLQGLADHCGGTLERLHTTEELLRSEARLAEIYANMDDAVFVMSVSNEGRFAYETFNPRCEKVTGLTSAAVHGRSPDEVLPPENAAILMPRYRECLESGRVVHYESDLTYPAGRHCWSTTLVPIRNVQGRIYRIAGISRDITTQKFANELIAGQRDLFEHIAAGQPLAATLEEICRYTEARADGWDGWVCSVLVLDPHTRRLHHGAAPNLPAAYCRAIDGVAIGPNVGSCGTAAFRRQTVTVTDIDADPLWADYRELTRAHGLRACWSTPIFGRVGEVLGTLALYAREPREPTAVHEMTLRLATHAASIAIQQARDAANLRRSEERFEVAFRASPVAMFLSTLAEGRLIEVNEAFLRLFGYADRDEVLERTSLELGLWPEPKDRERLATALRDTGKLTQFEQSFRTKSGELRHSLSSAERIDLQGRACVLSLVFDITDRQRAEARLAEAEQARARQFALLQASLDNLSEGVVVSELDGQLVYWNRAALELHGYRSLDECRRHLDEFTGTFEFRAADGQVVPHEQWPLARLLRGETVRNWEATLIHRQAGWKKQFTFTGTLARDDTTGRPLLAVITMVDITARRELEGQFRQSQKMEAIGQLAGGVAHDFNNILTAILARAELASHEARLSPSVAEALAEVQRLGQRAARLTSQLLAFSRRSMMQPAHLNLNDVVTEDTKMIRRMVGEDIRLEIALHAGPIPIHADAGMLAQVLLNLAVNARDAMPHGGRLMLETSRRILPPEEAQRHPDLTPGPYACLLVRDTGAGIAPEVLPRIFEPFFTTTPIGQGTGLGLATIFGIVRQHRGAILVDSRLGAGTTFEVLLPIDESAVLPAALPAPAPAPRGTETILLVEDEPAVRDVTRLLLKQHGYRVLEAEHGPGALKLWSDHRQEIALLLTDLVMPEGISGRDLADRLQGDSPALKVILMTGYSADIVHRGIELKPGQNFLQKPFEAHALFTMVRQTLDGR